MNKGIKNNRGIALITLIIAIIIVIVLIVGVATILIKNSINADKNNNYNTEIDKYEQSNDYNSTSSKVNKTYLKMAKEIWKQEEILLNAVKNGDIQTLVENAREDEYMIDDFIKNKDEEFYDAASEYLKFMYSDLTWEEPDEDTYTQWALYLERMIKEKLKGEGLSDDWITLTTGDLIKGKQFYKISSKYRELYPNATGEWNNETTIEAYEKLSKTLNEIPTENLYLSIDILEFDTDGNFVLAYDSLLDDTEIELLDISYWLRDRYGNDSWVGHFIVEEVLD